MEEHKEEQQVDTFHHNCRRCLVRGGALRLGGLLPFSPRERGERGEQARRGERGEHTRRGRRGELARQGAQAGREEKAPTERTGRTGRTYPSGIASPVEPEGLCIAASGGDAQSSFA